MDGYIDNQENRSNLSPIFRYKKSVFRILRGDDLYSNYLLMQTDFREM